MTIPIGQSHSHELMQPPIALIAAQNESFVFPIREYLDLHGCRTLLNTVRSENATYFFIVGDREFVKTILAFKQNTPKKIYIITWDEDIFDEIPSFVKIAYIDPQTLTDRLVNELFSFFFTGRKAELHLQAQSSSSRGFIRFQPQSLKKKTQLFMTEELPSGESASDMPSEDEDKSRIAQAITSIFGIQKTESGKKQPKSISRLIVYATLGTLVVILSPYILYVLSLFGSLWAINQSIGCLKSADAPCVKKQTAIAKSWHAQSRLASGLVHPTIGWLYKERGVVSYDRLFIIIEATIQTLEDATKLNDSLGSSFRSLIGSLSGVNSASSAVLADSLKKNLPLLRSQIDMIATNIQLLKNSLVFPFYLPRVQTLIQNTQTQLVAVRKNTEAAERILLLYPNLGGFRQKHKMLVLLQNNSELRPTGGFIGSVIRLDIVDGSIMFSNIEDVYALDGQLKGHVDPPTQLKELMGQEHWYLRDSNWSPDFPTSAKMAAWFYEKETGETVDSVVGLTSSVVLRLLELTGPIDLPAYNERISAANFFAKSLYYTQTDFFPGSTQKKDFLGSLSQALLEKLKSDKQIGAVGFLRILNEAVEKKDIQIFSTDAETEAAIVRFRWGGKTPEETTCAANNADQPCLFSYLSLNEANVGVNKVNTFIDRNDDRYISLGENGEVSQTITRHIRNLSGGEPGSGTYTVFLRILVPKEVSLQSFSLDGKNIPTKDIKTNKQALPYGEILHEIPDVTVASVAFDVPAGTEKVISLTYIHDQKLSFAQKGGTLTLFTQKQAGIDSVPTTVSLTYPPAWQIETDGKKDGSLANPGVFKYNTTMSKEDEHIITFTR